MLVIEIIILVANNHDVSVKNALRSNDIINYYASREMSTYTE